MNQKTTFTERANAFACSLQGRMMPTETTQLLKDMAAAIDSLEESKNLNTQSMGLVLSSIKQLTSICETLKKQ